jgi:anti-sigma B factor antagonist
MILTIDRAGQIPVAKMAGEWRSTDGETYLEELHALVAEPGSKLAIDMSGLKMLDSSGLSVLINVVTRARLSRSRVVLMSPSPFVSGVFEVTHLNRWFDLCQDLPEAAKLLNTA